jgi:uncharacterized membrane protein (UPF0127 family)
LTAGLQELSGFAGRCARSWRLALTVLLALAAALPTARASAQARTQAGLAELAVTTAIGRHIFYVEIADTDAARTRGLMFRRTLAPDHGMFFVFDRSEPLMFWMKNTYVPLDIIFIGADGVVRNIAADATPLSESLIKSAGPARYVLELLAGTAARIGMTPGDHVGLLPPP